MSMNFAQRFRNITPGKSHPKKLLTVRNNSTLDVLNSPFILAGVQKVKCHCRVSVAILVPVACINVLFFDAKWTRIRIYDQKYF